MTSLNVQAAGVYFGVLENIPPEFYSSANVGIDLKDGYKLVDANAAIFKERFADPGKKTTILLLDADYAFMGAVSAMDPYKTPVSQVNDCLRTIARLQDIRKDLLDEGNGDCAQNVTLAGYNYVPTQNIFWNDDKAVIKFYETPPYRDKLIGAEIDRKASPEAQALYDRTFDSYQALLLGRTVKTENGPDIVLPPARNLWDYKTPGWVADLRR